MQQYVAFDVSKQSSEAVIVDEAGNRLVSRKVRTDPSAMAAFVAKYGENVAMVGFEAGPLSTWLCHELKGAGLPVVCMASWRAGTALSARLNKTDRTDAAAAAMHRRLRAMARADADCCRLMTTPGVGPIPRGAAGTPRPRMGPGLHERHRQPVPLPRQSSGRRLFRADPMIGQEANHPISEACLSG